MQPQTVFASLDDYTKGGVEITGKEKASRYLFSNMFEVAANSRPWDRVVVARNLEFTIEVARAEGRSPWYACAHDETVLSMEGVMTVHFVQPADTGVLPSADSEGAVRLAGEPAGEKMGRVVASRGHLTLLPQGAAYRFSADGPGVILIQSVLGAESIEKWAEICQR
jgi:hypothetical protein